MPHGGVGAKTSCDISMGLYDGTNTGLYDRIGVRLYGSTGARLWHLGYISYVRLKWDRLRN